MDRGATSSTLSWLLLPVCFALALGALSLPRLPYTGVQLRDGWVAHVEPGSPGARAGLLPGDRVQSYPPTRSSTQHPLALAAPSHALHLLRERAGQQTEITLTPEPLPVEERRMIALFLVVASGFVVLGGWTWSERRDPLSRALFLMCLAFAWMIAPIARFSSPTLLLIYETIYSGATVFLPALLVHFFALFPEETRATGRLSTVTRSAYGVSIALFLGDVVLALARLAGASSLEGPQELLESIAALWFAAGAIAALALFVRSYVRAHDDDARRRLRVALVGTIFGIGPLAALLLLRNLFPGFSIPGERSAVLLTLLVPASFAWASAVHRVFEVRLALRAGVVLSLLLVAAGGVYAAGEWLAGAWRPDLGHGIAGGALAFVAFVAAVAGPAAAGLRSLGERVVPDEAKLAPRERLERREDLRRASTEALLEAACEAVAEWLRLDGCAALELVGGPPRLVARAGRTRPPQFGAATAMQLRALSSRPVALAEAALEPAARQALEMAGVCWLVPLGSNPARAVLALGRRLAGPWLSLPEIHELETLAAELELRIENATLREAASAHGHMDRELVRAQAIQSHLLPRRAPAYASLDCAAAALSSEQVGGDYYDFVKSPGRVLTLAVGDAAGKGVPAALMGVWAQACFRNEARRGSGPGGVLTALNRELVSMEQPEAFVALACMRIEVRAARMHYANAGLTPPMLCRADGTVRELSESGVLLGVMRDAEYRDTTIELEAGDVIVLYTDGLTEALRGQEMFGAERVADVLKRNAGQRAGDIVRALIIAVREFTDQPLDDLTVVVLKQVRVPIRTKNPGVQETLKWEREPADVRG